MNMKKLIRNGSNNRHSHTGNSNDTSFNKNQDNIVLEQYSI